MFSGSCAVSEGLLVYLVYHHQRLGHFYPGACLKSGTRLFMVDFF